MKLHRLELEGFGPFRARQAVDFDAFDRDGLFLISGRTGAGKSSILDGVSFALFGSVPRFGGGDRRLRSDYAAADEPTQVCLEFTVGDHRWRVTRSPEYERPAKRGGGVTSASAQAVLEQLIGDVWVGQAKGPRDVGHALSDVLGLGADQFQQVILLAQNQFSRFLLAGVRERQDLLRTLFGSRRFEHYRDELKERAKAAQQRIGDARTRAEMVLSLVDDLIIDAQLDSAEGEVPVDVAARVDRAEHALQRAEYRVEQRDLERQRADEVAAVAAAALERARADAAVVRELAGVRERIARLDAAEPHIVTERERLVRARAAAALRIPVETAARAEAELDRSRSRASDARDAWAADDLAQAAAAAAGGDGADVAGAGATPAGDAPDEAAAMDAVIARLTGDLALWGAAAIREGELDAALARLSALTAESAAHVEALAQLDAQAAALPAEHARLEEELRTASTRAARADGLKERLDAATARREAVRDVAALTADAAQYDADADARLAEATRAGESVTDLMRRRLAGYAGELAAHLVEGAPCDVCGSTEHPSPAARADAPVSDDDLQDAQRARDQAEAAARTASDRAAQTRAALAAATSRSGGLTIESADAALEAARADVADATAAAGDVARLTAERVDLDARMQRSSDDRARATEGVTAAREEAAREETRVHELRAAVDAARGPFDTVSARIARAEDRRGAAIALRDALRQLRDAERSWASATADRDERIAASDFTDSADVVSALLDDAACAAIDEQLEAHKAERAATKSRALELELAASSISEPVEVAAAQEAAEAADLARTEAITAAGHARSVVKQLSEQLTTLADERQQTHTLEEEAAVITRLADTVAGRAPNTFGMDLETFVLAAELEEIVRAANARLSEMSAGRYTLHHTDARVSRGASGLGIEVLDAHTGRLRSPQSLSGGETFLASLALALGLADVVTSRAGGLRLDTLFVDEGFGSLDPETLELAMRTLDELRAGGRTVGLISHVEAMKEQIPAQLVVTATPEGPSTIAVR